MRFQRFPIGSRTGRPVCGSSGSQPIGLEPEPEPVNATAPACIGSRTATAHTSRDETNDPGSLQTSGGDCEVPQTAAYPADLIDAISDALADALVAEYLTDLDATVDSPRGTNHTEAA
jgi:hypothetical protein